MSIVAACRRLSTAAAVFLGAHGAVSRLASQRAASRQALYREADAAVRDLDGAAARQQLRDLRDRAERLRGRVAELEARLRQAVAVDAERRARFAATAQAEGVSLPVARRLLAVLLGPRAPSVAALGRMAQAAARRAGAALAALDAAARPLARQAAADEIFFGRRPCLMLVEQGSLCWLTGRLAQRRDGAGWARELRRLPRLGQLTRDAGNALGKGVALANAERGRQGQAALADQEDVFHALRAGGRPLRRLRGRAARLLAGAEAAQRRALQARRRGARPQGPAGVAARAWRRAERAMDEWSAAEGAWREVRQALRPFTPAGRLNTRGDAEALLRAALPRLAGPGWSKARRLLRRPQLLTFLDRAQRGLAALPVAAELRAAAVRAEGLGRQPEALRGGGRSAACLRGALWAAWVVLHHGGAAGAEALARVRQVLGGAWRASRLGECVNSVARMQQARHRRMTQGLLDLKRLYRNCREFRTGRRRGQTPYGLLGVRLPAADWWELLKLPPERLHQELSAPGVAA
jgi:hypothetical protein